MPPGSGIIAAAGASLRRHGDPRPSARRAVGLLELAEAEGFDSGWVFDSPVLSKFGEGHLFGPDAARFYTKTKTMSARWPEPKSETGGADLSMPTNR